MTITVHPPVTAPRDLVSPDLFTRLALRVAEDENADSGTAAAITEQALGFLLACALNPDRRLGPSRQVDAGWHAFILHTHEYAEFCERIAGRFIHHAPAAPGDNEGTGGPGAAVEAMREAGIPVDVALWTCGADCNNDKCHQCHAGCYDSPKGT